VAPIAQPRLSDGAAAQVRKELQTRKQSTVAGKCYLQTCFAIRGGKRADTMQSMIDEDSMSFASAARSVCCLQHICWMREVLKREVPGLAASGL
jgi:hypothetical protein